MNLVIVLLVACIAIANTAPTDLLKELLQALDLVQEKIVIKGEAISPTVAVVGIAVDIAGPCGVDCYYQIMHATCDPEETTCQGTKSGPRRTFLEMKDPNGMQLTRGVVTVNGLSAGETNYIWTEEFDSRKGGEKVDDSKDNPFELTMPASRKGGAKFVYGGGPGGDGEAYVIFGKDVSAPCEDRCTYGLRAFMCQRRLNWKEFKHIESICDEVRHNDSLEDLVDHPLTYDDSRMTPYKGLRHAYRVNGLRPGRYYFAEVFNGAPANLANIRYIKVT